MLPSFFRAVRCRVSSALPSLIVATLAVGVVPALGQQKRTALPPLVPPPAPVRKSVSFGVFTDRGTKPHPWTINNSHALIWDNAPYIPVGGTFLPRSLEDGSDIAWKQDVAALAGLKARGLTDILVSPASALNTLPIARFQRIIDYLDANDFRYGVAFGAGITAALTGTVVKPSAYRFAETRDALTATWQVADTDNGIYVLVDVSDDSKIVRAGFAPAHENIISAPIDSQGTSGKLVAILYPHKALPAQTGAIPDLWNAFDDYRDRTIAFLTQVKFGKGFRFFSDPLAPRIGLQGETDYLIPDSPNFVIEWEAFLTRRYPNLDEAKLAWGLSDASLKTQQDLSHLVPLWANTNGIPYLYDRVTTRLYRISDARQSHWWQDFLECRNEGIQYYMNAMADVVKQIANVPVVYSWTHIHPIFTNPNSEGGFDGISVNAHGDSLMARILGPAYSAAEQSNRTIWCIANGVDGGVIEKQTPRPTATLTASNGRPAVSVPASTSDIYRNLDLLRRGGWKGFFVNGFQADASAENGTRDWLGQPADLDALHAYSERIKQEANAGTYLPHILFFPQSAPGPAHVGLVPGTSDVLWLNAFYTGDSVDWWPCYSGYSVLRPDAPGSVETVLISLQGRKETHLALLSSRLGDIANPKAVQAFTPDGLPVPIRIAGPNMIAVTLESTPIVFKTPGYRLIPQEAAETVISQLDALVLRAAEQHVPSVDSVRAPLDAARFEIKRKDYESAYWRARTALDELTAIAQPYIWIEGESAKIHTFTEIAPNAEASSSYYLRLFTPNPPTHIGYAARYYFDVPAEGKYNVWLAGTLPGPGTSPIKWKVNAEPEREPTKIIPAQTLYVGERFGWTLLGTVSLAKGQGQSLGIFVTDRAQTPPEYIFSIDALLLTTQQFIPNATFRPMPMLTSDHRTAVRQHGREIP